MKLSEAQVRCLEYAASVVEVSAWPADIADAPIRECRRAGYLETSVITGGFGQYSNIAMGPRERDRITEAGRAALGLEVAHDQD